MYFISRWCSSLSRTSSPLQKATKRVDPGMIDPGRFHGKGKRAKEKEKENV